jgi:hypothetical protein
MIAIYRMAHDGWTAEQAYDERLRYDFDPAYGHKGFNDYTRLEADPASVSAAYTPALPASEDPRPQPKPS